MSRSIRRPALALAALFLAAAPAVAADRAADLAAFKTEFFARDAAYAPDARAEAERRLAALEEKADGMSPAAFELALAEIVALADNGHTKFYVHDWARRYPRLPLQFVILNGKLHIGEAAQEDLVGAEVTAIEGRPWPQIVEALSRYQGGLPGWEQEYLPFFLEAPAIMQAAGLAESADALALSGVDAEGAEFSTRIEAAKPDPGMTDRARILSLGAGENAPLYLQEPGKLYRFEELEDGVVYIQFRANAGEQDGVDAVSFSESAIDRLAQTPPRHIILDQRFNAGGDLNNTRKLMQALPDFVGDDGKVWAIVSGRTFSAGVASVGYLKQAGGERVVIVGEPIGDRLEFWAEGSRVELPASGARLLYATERHNYMTGCQEQDCHAAIRERPIKVESLNPDYYTPLDYAAFKAGRDPAMEKILALIAAE